MERRSAEKCGFCGLRRDVLAARGTLLVCDDCLRLCADIVAARPAPWTGGDPACTFCGKRSGEVTTMVAGPTTYICDACISDAQRAIG
ncbi:MAG TPA: ClpX C4-type zinc finger protein [Labilithrix sp.]|jgi:hypothetical protein